MAIQTRLMAKATNNSFEVIPGVILLDANSSQIKNSNILLSIMQNGVVTTHHYANGNLKALNSESLLEGALAEPELKPVSKSGKVFSKTMLITGYTLAVFLFVFSLFSFTGIVKARVVLTGSMAPAIRTGDVIITTPIKYKNPKVGDVVAYQAKRFNGSSVGVFSHRIVGGDMYSGFIVKGDSNKLPDSQRPRANDILGVVIFVIPIIGNLLTPKALFLLVPTIFGFYLIVDAMRNVE